MSYRPYGRPSRTGFRPSALTQHPEPRPSQKAIADRARTSGDTIPGRSAREWFAYLLPKLEASRPVIEPASTRVFVREHTFIDAKGKTRTNSYKQTVVVPPRYGKPTFHNIILDGVHL